MLGRSLRTDEGKTHAIILDHTDNYQRLGLPDSEHNWSLDGVKTVELDSNSTGIGGGLHNQRRRDIQHIEGELIEIYTNSTEVISEDQRAGHKMISKKIFISGREWTLNSELVDILKEKLSRLSTLEEQLNQRNTDRLVVQKTQPSLKMRQW
jgi:superfamily II DNA or RNA helicase